MLLHHSNYTLLLLVCWLNELHEASGIGQIVSIVKSLYLVCFNWDEALAQLETQTHTSHLKPWLQALNDEFLFVVTTY